MTNSVTVAAPASGTVGSFLAISGTVYPESDIVQLQISGQNATLPTGAWYSAQTVNGTFTGLLLPVASGTWYAWAYDPISGAQGTSGAIEIGAAGSSTVPIPTSIVASLLGGTAGGETVDELPTAAAVADTDNVLVSQNSKTLFAQPFSAIWSWIQSHLPGYLLPQVTISNSGTVQLDNSAHNQRVLLITATDVTISPLTESLGPGFVCDLINASGNSVELSGITTNTGASAIAAGGIARLLAATPPGGTVEIYAKL